MDWEAVGALGDLVGGVGVVVTLAYLAAQVRYARREMRRSIYVQRQEAVRELSLSRANNLDLLQDQSVAASMLSESRVPEFAERVIERTGLSRASASRLMWDEYAWWYFRTQQIPFLDELPQGERDAFDNGIRFNYEARPLGRLWYETQRPLLSADAVRYVDSVLARGVWRGEAATTAGVVGDLEKPR